MTLNGFELKTFYLHRHKHKHTYTQIHTYMDVAMCQFILIYSVLFIILGKVLNIIKTELTKWAGHGCEKETLWDKLITVENNAVRIDYTKAKIDNMQQISKFILCGDRYKNSLSHNKQMQRTDTKEYKSRHDWVGKVIHWNLCKRLKFNQTDKWYMQITDSFIENDIHKILWDFVIQTNRLILARPRIN